MGKYPVRIEFTVIYWVELQPHQNFKPGFFPQFYSLRAQNPSQNSHKNNRGIPNEGFSLQRLITDSFHPEPNKMHIFRSFIIVSVHAWSLTPQPSHLRGGGGGGAYRAHQRSGCLPITLIRTIAAY